MQRTEGFLLKSYNPTLYRFAHGGDFNETDEIYIKVCGDAQESLTTLTEKLRRGNPCFRIPFFRAAHGDGKSVIIKFTCKRLSSAMGPTMLSTPRKNWFNKEYDIIFKPTIYKFRTAHGETCGVNFLLKRIEITY